MSYQAGQNKMQYRCVQCGVVSPHAGECFCCGSSNKRKEVIPEIVRKIPKGQKINISVR